MADKSGHDERVVPGWYVFQDGKIKGPLTAAEALEFRSKKGGKEVQQPSPSSDRYVSRVGFKKWYPVEELRPIYREVTKIEAKAADDQISFERALDRNLSKVKKLASVKSASHAKVKAHEVGRAKASTPSKNSVNHAVPPIQQAPIKQQTVKQQTVQQQAAKQQVVEQVAKQAETEKPAAKEQASATKQSVSQTASKQVSKHEAPCFLTLKGRLRLGQIHNGWKIGLVDFILTLGFIWPFWFRRLANEVAYHQYNTTKVKVGSRWWLACIPVFHLVACYQLACEVVAMESQNGYQKTKPFLALIFGLVPPLYMIYLQRGVTHHWQAHVQYMERRQAARAS